jgi:hypothetical protein
VETGPGKEGREARQEQRWIRPGEKHAGKEMSGGEPRISKYMSSYVSREFARRTIRPFKLVKYIID